MLTRMAYIVPLQTGLQEKAAFIQAFQHASIRSSVMVCPALIGILLAVTGAFYLYHHAPMAQTTGRVHEEAIPIP